MTPQAQAVAEEEVPFDQPVEVVQEKAMLNEGSAYVQQARQIAAAIKDQPSFQAAAEFRSKGKSRLKEIFDFFKPTKQKMDEAKKEVLNREKMLAQPYEEADRLIQQSQNAFLAEQERVRKAEQDRLEAEERARAEAARNEEAERLRKAGNKAAAKAVMAEPLTVQAPVVLPETKAAGAIAKKVWKVEVTDKRALIRAIADGKVPIGVVEIDEVELKKWAAQMEVESPCPGVRAWQEFSTGARAK